jgi:Family of unknown function (DUF6308)
MELLTSDQTWIQIDAEDVRRWLLEAIWIHHYDVIRTQPDRMEILDLAIPAFLDAPPHFKKLLGGVDGREGRPVIETKLREITEALHSIPQHTDLWDWNDDDANRANLKTLLRACRLPQYGVASIFKMLHLKRPQLIPVIDDWARRAWTARYSEAWTLDELVETTFLMGKELGARQEGLNEMREVAVSMGWPYNSLSRLRLYDIVFWCYEFERRTLSG